MINTITMNKKISFNDNQIMYFFHSCDNNAFHMIYHGYLYYSYMDKNKWLTEKINNGTLIR